METSNNSSKKTMPLISKENLDELCAGVDFNFDDAFADADWINTWQEALALVDEVRSDNFEQCELIYTAE